VNERSRNAHPGTGAANVGAAKGTPMSVTNTVDVLVQAATVDLFRSYGLAIAPAPKRRASAGVGQPGDIVASIRFSGSGVSGTLWLVASPEMLQQTRSSGTRVFQAVDWARELVNQLMGRIKNRLLRYQVVVHVEFASAALRPGSVVFDKGDVYAFRTLRGEIAVVLAASFDGARFVYSTAELGSEGDVVLF